MDAGTVIRRRDDRLIVLRVIFAENRFRLFRLARSLVTDRQQVE